MFISIILQNYNEIKILIQIYNSSAHKEKCRFRTQQQGSLLRKFVQARARCRKNENFLLLLDFTRGVSNALQCCGSGAFFTPGLGIRKRFFTRSLISDPGYQTHILESLVTIFWVKNIKILSELAQILLNMFKNKIIYNLVP
jgi:hypothetical protein